MCFDQSGMDELVTMLLRSREMAVDDRLDAVLPALDAALFIAGQEIARRLADQSVGYVSNSTILN
uniref:Uncharacterized protein n=2 Tax=Aureimonas frigidaquae TaxID=424757 RepID=A0A0P0Z208_9HYPH|nr:hypothetical protein [Aureimonas frigidaquae]